MRGTKILSFILSFLLLFNVIKIDLNESIYAEEKGIKLDPIPSSFDETSAKAFVAHLFPENSGIEQKISNVKINYMGDKNMQIGYFKNAKTGKVLSFEEGIALSTGNLFNDLRNENTAKNTTGSFGKGASESINGNVVYDPCSIEFDLNMEQAGNMVIQYAFGSEEYTEYSTSNYNDKFGIIVGTGDKAKNYAVVPNTNQYIAINTINQISNTEFFIDNTDKHLPIELDGITKTFSSSAELKKGTNHVKIIIGDKGDRTYDSVLFIKAKSFQLKENKPGKLSIERSQDGSKVVVSRTDGTDGAIAFTIKEENFEGDVVENTYILEDGENTLDLPINTVKSDAAKTIAVDTVKVTIKDAKMGATIEGNSELTLKIKPPVIKKDKDNTKIIIEAETGVTVTLYKKGSPDEQVATGLNNGNEYTIPSDGLGEYYAVATKTIGGNTLTSIKSNILTVKKPPVITSDVADAFNELTIEKGGNFDIDALNVVAKTASGTPINVGENFIVEKPADMSKAGIYTVKWTAKDSGFTTVKTKIVKVRPLKPTVFKADYKKSVIFIEGEPNAIVSIKDDSGNVLYTIELNDEGKGKLVNPPNGSYKASQTVNGVESDFTSSLEINRVYNRPVITLIGENTIEGTFELEKSTNETYSYTEQGATVTDAEDDKKEDVGGSKIWLNDQNVNIHLTPKLTIDNPMFSKEGKDDKINVTNPALNEDGTPVDANKVSFKPFVGKYEIKYNVSDTDGLEAETVTRLVRVKPYKPTVSLDPANGDVASGNNKNKDSSIMVDALSTASVFLYKKDIDGEYKPVKIENGEADFITDESLLYKDGEHAKLKMAKGANLYTELTDKISALPDGDYKVLQRLYGLNSELSESIKVTHDNHVPLIKLTGAPTVYVTKGHDYEELGAMYSIGEKNDQGELIEHNVENISRGNFDKDVVGKYEVTYTVDNNSKSATVKRTVVVRPAVPTYLVGDYDEDTKKFKENPNGNDLQVSGIENGASVQLVKGENGNGALYEQKFNQNDTCVFVNLPKTNGSERYGVFQTVNEIQSAKNNTIEIYKSNTPPTLTLTHPEAMTVNKNDDLSLSNADTEVSATDTEDKDTELSAKIRIYKDFTETADGVIKLSGDGATEVKVDTSTVGSQKFYYAVKDSDGNTVMTLREVIVLPAPPVLTVDGNTNITAGNLENNAVVKLYKKDESGNWILFDTKVANASGDDIDFIDLDTGVYKAVQTINAFESGDSKTKPFANPAYINAHVVNKDGQALEGVTFTVKENDPNISEISDENGTALIGVESANKLYKLELKDKNGKKYEISALSSEEPSKVSTFTAVVGSLLKDGKQINIPNNQIKLSFKKEVDGKYVETHIAKAKYKDGQYTMKHLEAGQKYKLDFSYLLDPAHPEKGALALASMKVVAGTKGSIKIVDHELKTGIVKDESGNPLKGATIEVYPLDRDGKADYQAGKIDITKISGISNSNAYITEADGKYAFSVFDAVPYAMIAKKAGYQDKEIIVDSANGNLLAEEIVMTKRSNSSNSTHSKHSSSSSSRKSRSDDEDKDEKKKEDKKKQDKKKEDEKKNKEESKREDGLKRIKDVKVEDILDGAKKTDKGYVKPAEKVADGSYLAYTSQNKKRDDKVVKEPEKGKLFVNPETGSMIYIPNKNEKGKDSFTIETKDKKGKSVKLENKVNIEKQSNTIFGKRDSLVLEIRSDNRRGFKGEEFDIDVEFMNNLDKDVKNATIALQVPEGFDFVGDKYKVKDSYVIIPVKDLKKDAKSKIDLKLKAVDPSAKISKVKALIQENGSERIYPEAVSALDLKVSSLNTKYYAKPYVHGYPDGSFDREGKVTRAEVAAMLTRCLKNDNEAPENTDKADFTDVGADKWYAKYVQDAVNYGLFSGFEDGSFRPDDKITRAQLAMVIGNYLKLDISESGVIEQPYSDVHNHWARDEINALNRYGISMGYEDGSFKPNTEVSRQETVKMINNMLYRHELPHVESSFHDMESADWSFGDIESAYRGYSYEMDSESKKLNIQSMN